VALGSFLEEVCFNRAKCSSLECGLPFCQHRAAFLHDHMRLDVEVVQVVPSRGDGVSDDSTTPVDELIMVSTMHIPTGRLSPEVPLASGRSCVWTTLE
jgi:hypothetical protein